MVCVTHITFPPGRHGPPAAGGAAPGHELFAQLPQAAVGRVTPGEVNASALARPRRARSHRAEKPGEQVVIDNGITLTVVEVRGNRVRLAFVPGSGWSCFRFCWRNLPAAADTDRTCARTERRSGHISRARLDQPGGAVPAGLRPSRLRISLLHWPAADRNWPEAAPFSLQRGTRRLR
jgi:hypothetical protein